MERTKKKSAFRTVLKWLVVAAIALAVLYHLPLRRSVSMTMQNQETGESAALLFTAGFGLRLLGFKAALESSSASLSVALYLYASEQGKFDIAFGIAAVLLMLTLALNLLASLTARKAGKER